MLSLIIPTLNAESGLTATIEAAATSDLVKQTIVSDGGSIDRTETIATEKRATFIKTPKGRGIQLAEGAKHANQTWLLFIHADTVLGQNWSEEVAQFIAQEGSNARAAVFQFALDDGRLAARRIEWLVTLRCNLFALPYGDQGLLISRELYDQIGGFQNMVLFEDVDIIRRIGRRRLHYFKSCATTSAERYRRSGFFLRPLKNLYCLSLYFLGVSPERIARIYR